MKNLAAGVRIAAAPIAVAVLMSGLVLTATVRGTAAESAPPAERIFVPKGTPSPPKLPKNFQGRGTYVVPSLGKTGTTVPFWWNGKNGNFRMVAGSRKHKIWFTNAVINGNLYTYTYKWPGIPSVPCEPIPGASRTGFNKAVKAAASFVGPETIFTSPSRQVSHWRMGGAFTPFDGVPIRFPLAQADIYVDKNDSRIWRQVLHFGYQNLYAKDLDEWIQLKSWKLKPGKVKMPGACKK